MKKTPIDLYAYAGELLRQLPKGILLTTSWQGTEDTMTIGWGSLGTDWQLPVFTVFVRESRYTHDLLDQSGEFTISAPLDGMDVRKILSFCGTVSGRDQNKFEALNLHTVPGEKVASPAIAELPLTLECKVIYRQDQDDSAIPEPLKSRFYANGDLHTAYIGQIVSAYLLEEE